MLVWGTRDRRFESSHPDKLKRKSSRRKFTFLRELFSFSKLKQSFNLLLPQKGSRAKRVILLFNKESLIEPNNCSCQFYNQSFNLLLPQQGSRAKGVILIFDTYKFAMLDNHPRNPLLIFLFTLFGAGIRYAFFYLVAILSSKYPKPFSNYSNGFKQIVYNILLTFLLVVVILIWILIKELKPNG